MAYEFDLFISYKRSGNVREWVNNHFFPVLKNCLEDLLPLVPRIFFDRHMDTGVNWPNEIQRALLRTKYMVAIWSPPYFQSKWCLAEWKSMLRRQEQLGMASTANPQGLVFPVVFSDGHHFPPEAQATQAKQDLAQWRFPYPQFKETRSYLDFHSAVEIFAEELAMRIPDPPEWDEAWPVELPDPGPAPKVGLPRF